MERIRDETIMKLGRATEKADPTSGDGAGEISCAETAVVVAENTAIAKRIIMTFAMLTCAISKIKQESDRNTEKQRGKRRFRGEFF